VIIRTLDETIGTEREVRAATWCSRRLLLADDGLGYSFHDTLITAGTTTEMWYQHHVEAVYCIEGTGVLVDRERGTEHPIGPGTVYVLDGRERHTVRADSDLRMICVFTPALSGRETHDENGTYPLATDEAAS
jgi:L-ectoine synthase